MATMTTLAGISLDAGTVASARGASFGQKLGQLLNHNPRRSLDVIDRQLLQLPRQTLNAAVTTANSTSLSQGFLLDPDFSRSSRNGCVNSSQDITVRTLPTLVHDQSQDSCGLTKFSGHSDIANANFQRSSRSYESLIICRWSRISTRSDLLDYARPRPDCTQPIFK